MRKKYISICDLLIAWISGCETQKQTEPIDIVELTIAEIHNAYQNGTYNSQQLVAAYLEQIIDSDGEINALTTNNQMRLPLQETDKEYQKTKVLRPLHGIPLIVKDNIIQRGFRQLQDHWR